MRLHPKNIKAAAGRGIRLLVRRVMLSIAAGVIVGLIAAIAVEPSLRAAVGVFAGLGAAFITLVVLLLI